MQPRCYIVYRSWCFRLCFSFWQLLRSSEETRSTEMSQQGQPPHSMWNRTPPIGMLGYAPLLGTTTPTPNPLHTMTSPHPPIHYTTHPLRSQLPRPNTHSTNHQQHTHSHCHSTVRHQHQQQHNSRSNHQLYVPQHNPSNHTREAPPQIPKDFVQTTDLWDNRKIFSLTLPRYVQSTPYGTQHKTAGLAIATAPLVAFWPDGLLTGFVMQHTDTTYTSLAARARVGIHH